MANRMLLVECLPATWMQVCEAAVQVIEYILEVLRTKPRSKLYEMSRLIDVYI